jgi:nucleotide-binding universal stress UspA family protein
MQKILVPTDFSANAMKAVLYAAEIAKKSSATVYLLHLIEPVTDRIHQPYALHEKLEAEIANNRLKELDTLQKSITLTYPGIKTETELAKGTVTNSISDFAGNNQIDLIVMGTKGATGLKEIFLGSVAAGTIGKTKIPVLAIPDEYEMEEPDGILFATNHFEENKTLLNKIVDVAILFSATIHVAAFIDTDTADATDYLYNTRQLNHYMDFLKKSYPDVVFKGELLEGSEFEETIEKYDSKNEVDIIAMITYPKSFWERFMKKSMTKKMAFHTKIPLLAIPAK